MAETLLMVSAQERQLVEFVVQVRQFESQGQHLLDDTKNPSPHGPQVELVVERNSVLQEVQLVELPEQFSQFR